MISLLILQVVHHMAGAKWAKGRAAYLVTNSLQSWPVQPRKQVDEQLCINLKIILDELAFFWVEGEGGGGGFAGFDSASEEVESEDLHC